MTIAASAPAQVYKWVDERGVTHYGERPPMGGKATEVPNRLASPAPGAAAPRAAAETKNPDRVVAPQRQPLLRPGPTAPEKPEDRQERELARHQEQCNQQRELLTRLRQSPPSFTVGAKGERIRVDNSETIARQERLVAEQCRG
ncbi:MAG: DUF4124 domain-containing protein [Burkholderiales bacterium]